MTRQAIHSPKAPRAIGTYSQAMRAGNFIFLSGQLGIHPETLELESTIEAEIVRAFDNLAAVCEAAGGTLNDLTKVNIFLTDLGHFQAVNEVMRTRFAEPFPARATLGVAALPKGGRVEVDGILYLPD